MNTHEVIETKPRDVSGSAIAWYELSAQEGDGSWHSILRNFRILRQAGLMRPNRKARQAENE